jgi:periplasmic divalent cation tolerance protein
MTEQRLVLTTAGSRDEAHRIAHALVEERLAACVNIVPQIESIFRWKENVEQAQEYLLLIKTTGAAFAGVCDAIKQLHSYDLPECICLTIEEGSAPYLQWITDSVQSKNH